MRKVSIILLSIILSSFLYAQEGVKIIRDMKITSTPQSHFRHSDLVFKETAKQTGEVIEVVEEPPKEVKNDSDFNVIKGTGSGTFSNSPNALARIFTKNATVESIVATFQRYRAYYAEEFSGGRRMRAYDVYKGKEHYSVSLEYNATTRKVETIIIDDYYTDKFKQRLINAGYRFDSKTSMTATAFGHGYRSYWEKKGSPICFVFNDRIIKVFRTK